MAVLLHLHSGVVLALVRSLLSVREAFGALPVVRVTRRHGTAYRREADRGSGDLVTRFSGEVAQIVRAGDEGTTPVPEGSAGLADPAELVDATVKLVGCRLHSVACVPQGLARRLQVLRVRLVDQVDHLVEVEVLRVEVRATEHGLPRGGGPYHRSQGVAHQPGE
ncbi:hypothetical protein DF19_41195 [Streptomyces olindensis]|nr:hypothetical protein DF19_41195 [Streptomyces olindensis]